MTDDYVPPLGPRFSQLYLERGAAEVDSKRLRARIAAFIESKLYQYDYAISGAIQMRIGTDIRLADNTTAIADWLKTCSPSDFRDAMTVICEAIDEQNEKNPYERDLIPAGDWRNFCRDTFIEENVSFRVDDHCVVHPFVDDEFSRSTSTLLRGLTDPRLSAVRAEVEKALDDLGGREVDFKDAVRAMFEALEIYAKLSVKTCTVKRLNRNIVMEHIVRTIQSKPGYTGPSAEAAIHMGEGLVDWLDACHIYRHGQGVNEPSPPPPDLAVALVSAGATYLRWLLDNLPLPTTNDGT